MIEVIRTPAAPQPKGPYEQALRSGPFVIVTAQTGSDPATGALRDGATAQATQAARNVRAILIAAGVAVTDVVRLGIALCDMGSLADVNAALAEALDGHRCPRATSEVQALPGGALLSIEALAITRVQKEA